MKADPDLWAVEFEILDSVGVFSVCVLTQTVPVYLYLFINVESATTVWDISVSL